MRLDSDPFPYCGRRCWPRSARPVRPAAPRPGVVWHLRRRRPRGPYREGHGSHQRGVTAARTDKLRFPEACIALGHTRYSSAGSDLRFNAQPLTVRSSKGIIALAHNGNFTNALSLRARMLDEGAVFQTTNDSEVMLNLIARYSELSFTDATARVMTEMEGGFAVVLMDRERIIGLRDANGVRPLQIGRFPDGSWVFASEQAAFGMMGASYVRDVRPGELVTAGPAGRSEERRGG